MHLDEVEHKDSIVFLHSVEEGSANESYGLQVAQLAGVPAAVIRAARKNLALLEEHGLAAGPQRDLFAAAAAADAAANDARSAANDAAHPVLDSLRATDPDALSPKEALELVYRLRRQLDE